MPIQNNPKAMIRGDYGVVQSSRVSDIEICSEGICPWAPGKTELRPENAAEYIEQLAAADREALIIAATLDCPDSVRRNLELVIDEIAENISMYAYESVVDDSSDLAQNELGHGRMQLDMEMGANYARLRFQDCGTPFDPLAKTDPDVDGEPEIGGLGIYLVKNSVDDIRYERAGGRNVLDVLVLWGM